MTKAHGMSLVVVIAAQFHGQLQEEVSGKTVGVQTQLR